VTRKVIVNESRTPGLCYIWSNYRQWKSGMPKVSEGSINFEVIEQTDDSRRLMPGVQVNFISIPRHLVRYSKTNRS
jgi:hypothetical protein